MAANHAVNIDMSDISHCRKDFPILQKKMNGKPLAFLDTAASAQKPRQVIAAMRDVMEVGYANIHRGLYEISQDLTTRFEDVRRKVAVFLNAPGESNIVFTRNTTEAINLVAQSWGRSFLKEGDEIILTEIEHHANIVPWQLLRDQVGIVIKVIKISDQGGLDLDHFNSLLSKRTKMVGVVHVSNSLGTINPVKDIIAAAKSFSPDIITLVDGSQAVVHGGADVHDLDCDFYVFTGHKLYGPTGIGVLYGKTKILDSMPPYQGGGDMIERVRFEETSFKKPPFRFEAGTPPIIEVIGLGAAIDYVQGIGAEHIAEYEASLLSYMNDGLSQIPGLKTYGDNRNRAGAISFTMDGIHPSDIGMILDQCGVAVRTGHHCCMPLMQVLGVDATVRASVGLYTNKDDIEQLINGLHKVRDMFG